MSTTQYTSSDATSNLNTSGSDIFGFYCSHCQMQIPSEELYRLHHKSELHQYNLKRKIVSLPPVTQAQFDRRKNQMMETKRQQQVKEEEHSQAYCKVCRKAFKSRGTFEEHLKNKRHLQNEAKFKEEPESFDFSKKNKKEVVTTMKNINSCLFCNRVGNDLKENLLHMDMEHGFKVLDPDFCVDLEGLVRHLAHKISQDLLCIFCENRGCHSFKIPEAVQKHMMDRGHCFMNSDYFDEFDQFYDFTADNLKEAKRLEEKYENVKIEQADPETTVQDAEEEWEDEEEEDQIQELKSEQSSQFHKVGESHSQSNTKQTVDIEARREARRLFKLRKTKINDIGELILPSGKIAGHRNYMYLYRQNLRFGEDKSSYAAIRMGVNNPKKLAKMMHMGLISDPKTKQVMLRHYSKYLIKQKAKVDKIARPQQRRELWNYIKTSFQANRLQHYFREQNPIY